MNTNRITFDYIICGGGGAGLSLVHRFCEESFKYLSILIIEPEIKNCNDRTWCSWLKGDDRYSSIACKTWHGLQIFGKNDFQKQEKGGYHYRMIRSKDFYRHIEEAVSKRSNISKLNASVIEIKEESEGVKVLTDKGEYRCSHVFKSYVDDVIDMDKYYHLNQHFKGWFIRTENDVFDDTKCTLMDFRIDQVDDLRFLYVLPLNKREALVEVAIFSNQILSEDQYSGILSSYIHQYLDIGHYKIFEEEFGVIPMNNYPYAKQDTKKITHIGTAGGVVKPSTGYAFSRIQLHSDAIKDCILKGKNPSDAQSIFKSRFSWYDSIFLKVLINEKGNGYKVFEDLFSKNDLENVFDFLDEKTSISEELPIMWACDKSDFIKALLMVILKK